MFISICYAGRSHTIEGNYSLDELSRYIAYNIVRSNRNFDLLFDGEIIVEHVNNKHIVTCDDWIDDVQSLFRARGPHTFYVKNI